MIKQLRWRVAAMTIASVFTVLVVLMGLINVSNYMNRDKVAGDILQVLKENGGTFPDNLKKGIRPPAGSTDQTQNTATAKKDDTIHALTDVLKGDRRLNPETPFETRYFTVTLDTSGNIKETNIGMIAAVTEADAQKMTSELMTKGKTSGYYGNYKYLRSDTDKGIMYIFLDCTRDLESVNQFLKSSLMVSSVVFLAISGLIIAISPLMVRPIEESYRKQKSFITNAGHELKTPLAVIESCNDVIEMENGESKWTEGIRSQIKRMSLLTEDLVSLARLDEGYEMSQLETVDLSELTEEMTEPFILMAEQKGLKFELIREEGINVRGNRKQLCEMVSLLADNAVKYALPEGPIVFTLSRKGRRAQLVSSNHAEDVSSGKLEHFFDRFYRGDTSHSSRVKGYGIGLSMAQAIVQAHGGKIEATGEAGNILKITVKLPITT